MTYWSNVDYNLQYNWSIVGDKTMFFCIVIGKRKFIYIYIDVLLIVFIQNRVVD